MQSSASRAGSASQLRAASSRHSALMTSLGEVIMRSPYPANLRPPARAGGQTCRSEIRDRRPVDIAVQIVTIGAAIRPLAADGHVARGRDGADCDQLRLGLLVESRRDVI